MNFNIAFVKKITKSIDGWLTDKEGGFLYNTAKRCKGNGVIVDYLRQEKSIN